MKNSNSTNPTVIIALFMGGVFTTDDPNCKHITFRQTLRGKTYPPDEKGYYTISMLEAYKTDWNWIMSVVDYIEAELLGEDCNVYTEFKTCTIPFYYGEEEGSFDVYTHKDNKKEAVYFALLEWITAYNSYISNRLEYLRGEIRAERISYWELVELQELAKYIDKEDIELLQVVDVLSEY